MFNPFSLNSKTVLVTGASSGIGRAIAIEVAKMGANVLITGRNSVKLDDTFLMLGGSGIGNHKAIVLPDLRKEEEIEMLSDWCEPLDGVVHSAGIFSTIPVNFVSYNNLEEVFQTNFFSSALLTQKLLKRKKINNGASIIWISSLSGIVCSSVGSAVYSASKGAVNGFVKGIALDLASKKIRVNSILPGTVDTNIFSHGSLSKEQIEKQKEKYPLKRYGKPEEIAWSTIYLLSDASSWVTGSNIVIDGGFSLL